MYIDYFHSFKEINAWPAIFIMWERKWGIHWCLQIVNIRTIQILSIVSQRFCNIFRIIEINFYTDRDRDKIINFFFLLRLQ